MDPVFEALRIDIERTRRLLPPGLSGLADVVWNLAWSWLPGAAPLFRDIDAGLWQATGHNARAVLERAGPRRLTELATDPSFLERVEALENDLRTYMAAPLAPAAEHVRSRYGGRPAAYFCAEFGIHESLPLYAGGLGILAGDHLKSASDLGLPLIAVGLRYRQGYFHQGLDRTGWQMEYYQDTDFGSLPSGLLLKADGTPRTISIPLHDRRLTLQMWGIQVGRVPLLLLDSNRDDNDPIDRWITGHLYGGNRDTRLAQEMVLGIGGVRALRELGYDPAVFHMNEGHAAFLGVELLREELARGRTWEDALASVRERTVFTTHTPVPAGHDAFHQDQFITFTSGYLAELGATGLPGAQDRLLRLGRKNPDDAYEEFGMTPLAMHTSRSVNGVSRLHGEVCRDMWADFWPGTRTGVEAIRHVTNGVHLGSWMAPALRELLARHLGEDWERRQGDPRTWEAIDRIPDAELWETHCRLKERLVSCARDRSQEFRRASGEAAEYVAAARETFDPDALTIGFARRVATYKRLSLLLHDPERALDLLTRPGRPVQLVISGKAHPGDSEAKRLLQYLFRVRFDPRVLKRAVFLVDYNIEVARELVHGVDVWLNLPRRPQEASGTSGMKSALNGGLNCSILDGWWAEGFNGRNGWAIGGTEDEWDSARRDAEDAESLYSTLEQQIVPLYYDRDAAGVPTRWVSMMKEALKSGGAFFTTHRMVSEYAEQIYAP